jgi:threonine/homoserine/homoserine lactone efflux protein
MDISLLLKGLVIGFSIAAPVGPIGVLCIRRTLVQGRLYGFVSGLGAASADAIYGAIAGFGLTFISNFLVEQQTWLRLIGGLFLFVLGLKTLLEKPTDQAFSDQMNKLIDAYSSTFFLTFTNPITIISYVAIFAGLGLASDGRSYFSAGILVLGVFTGSMLWWLLLNGGAGIFREKFTLNGLQWINRISGVIIIGFGIYVFLSVV